jgi:hypothetical protein
MSQFRCWFDSWDEKTENWENHSVLYSSSMQHLQSCSGSASTCFPFRRQQLLILILKALESSNVISPLKKYFFSFLHFCLSICLSVYLSVCLFVCLSIFLSICLSVYLSVCIFVSVCLSLCLFVWMFVCLSFRLSVCIFVCLSICLSICLSVYLSVCLFVCLSPCFKKIWI